MTATQTSNSQVLAIDGFWRHGGTAEGLLPALEAKQAMSIARQWPDWRTISEDTAIEHDRFHYNGTSDALDPLGR